MVWGESGEGITTAVYPMPDTDGDIKSLFDTFAEQSGKTIVVMERVGGFVRGNPAPGSAMFRFGQNYGVLTGCSLCNNFRLELVTPQAWQKSLGLGTRGSLTPTQWKNKLKGEAQRLYPGLKITNKTADAVLLLEYARKRYRPYWEWQ